MNIREFVLRQMPFPLIIGAIVGAIGLDSILAATGGDRSYALLIGGIIGGLTGSVLFTNANDRHL
ncbi:MAG: hypothetical protein AAB955_01965 [Patescibacteria group bacterium]